MTGLAREKEADAIESVLGCLNALVFIFAAPFIAALGSIYEAYICTRLWVWFVAPFVAVKVVPLVVFIAADFIVLLLFRSRIADDKKRTGAQIWASVLGLSVFYPSAIWLTAYLIHRWVA